jgi:hypothetical protein
MKNSYRTTKGKLVKAITADGHEGYLLRLHRGWCFRVYTSDDKAEFIDYQIDHMDLQVQINDSSAAFYSDADGNKWLDYSPAILGYPRETQMLKSRPKKSPA